MQFRSSCDKGLQCYDHLCAQVIIIVCVGHNYKPLAATLPEYFLLMVMVHSSPVSFPPLEITFVATVEALSSNQCVAVNA